MKEQELFDILLVCKPARLRLISVQLWQKKCGTHHDVAPSPPNPTPPPPYGKQGQIGTTWTETKIGPTFQSEFREYVIAQTVKTNHGLLPSSLRDKLASFSDLLMMNILLYTGPLFFFQITFHHVLKAGPGSYPNRWKY